MKNPEIAFTKLVQVVADLRGPNGCPWDKEQTAKSLCQYIIEEAYELAEAIEGGNTAEIIEELGDYLFQVVLQSQVAQDEGKFTITDVVTQQSDKLIQRHPHVFGGERAENSEQVWKQWHQMKFKEGEKKQKPVFSYPRNMPALQAAAKIGKKTEGFKFDWPTIDGVLAKLDEEILELKQALQKKSKEEISHEIGDVLFTVAQIARHAQLDPEAAARESNRRFERRFLKVLEFFGGSPTDFAKLPDSEKEKLWQQAKKSV